jgi:hypothetical protein
MKTPGSLILSAVFLLLGTFVWAQEAGPSCPHQPAASKESEGHDSMASSGAGSDHHAGVDARGDKVMGFDHTKTTHHFLLSAAGGSIEVTANRAEDKDNRDAIRAHLMHIAKMFAEGDFEAPMLIHGRTPPGVAVMKRKRTGIQWKYEELENGGRVVATTKDPEALSAIHEFLRFQIADHRTGDPGTVKGISSTSL